MKIWQLANIKKAGTVSAETGQVNPGMTNSPSVREDFWQSDERTSYALCCGIYRLFISRIKMDADTDHSREE